ncbi:hypothetical protein BCON_0116g00110 [Botryotinia convoluta]|uniref:Uncharacterized protein n=1 Tax=Botryotinia convoluta TaxID=54673 RepID=A0A4Z1IB27_9HELO|nr:hypothetical protein BCON_0116g00110 [Botryotinia convoluta]
MQLIINGDNTTIRSTALLKSPRVNPNLVISWLKNPVGTILTRQSNSTQALKISLILPFLQAQTSKAAILVSYDYVDNDLSAVHADEKPARSYYLKTMSSLNPRAPVFIPSPRPLPPIPHHLAAANAAGHSFVAAYPDHPLATFAAEEVQMTVNDRALLLHQKEELREKLLVFHLDKFMLGTDGERRVVKSKN